MLPLPAEPFDPARLLQARVDGRARVCVRQNYYSVPARYAGRRVPVRLSAMSVQVLDGPQVVAAHERAAGKYAEVLTLDHYLEVLKYKPGAMPGATALAQARAAGAFTASHQRYWDAARCARGDAAGTRALIEVLLAHRALPAAAMTTAVSSGVLDPQVIVIEARRQASGQATAVIAIGALARYDRPAPALEAYGPAANRERRMNHCPMPPPRPRSASPPASCPCPPSAPRPPDSPGSPPGNTPPTCLPRRDPRRRADPRVAFYRCGSPARGRENRGSARRSSSACSRCCSWGPAVPFTGLVSPPDLPPGRRGGRAWQR
jgi:hypothetical protein